jgi:hypothetical protein
VLELTNIPLPPEAEALLKFLEDALFEYILKQVEESKTIEI